MKYQTIFYTLFLLPLIWGVRGEIFAQTTSGDVPTSNDHLTLISHSATPLYFNSGRDISTCTIPEAPIEWGMDVAWDDESNVRRGTNFITEQVMSTGRISFQPSDLVDANGNLSSAQKSALQSRLDHIRLSGVYSVALNCDHEALNKNNYYGKPEEWHKVIKATVKYVRSKGMQVVSIAPFNEPDYTAWGEGTKAHMKEICRLISEDSDLAGIRICAGNTLNCDQASAWYSYMKPYVNEGNTHQLAGSFDNYAKFWTTVRNDGNHATADELHNVMEAFVGVHYGMQTGIWWGYEAAARGEYCKASFYGKEIGYAENRSAWSGATVYKQPSGRIDAFFGTSERQATPSSYTLVATDRPQYFNGVGPQYAYEQAMPGGTGYQQGQTNAELWFGIQQGDDIPDDAIQAGSYVIMNRNSNMAIGYYNGAQGDAINIVQYTYTGTNTPKHMQWKVEPVDPRSGGDFGYFILRSERNTTQVIDVKNWSLDAGGTLIAYAGGLGTNEQWCTEYAGNGDWYIRSRHSGLYLEVKNSAKNKNAFIQQTTFTGEANQRWRFLPVGAALEQNAPAAPTGLTATQQGTSVLLQWTANTESDMAGYHVMRSANGTDWDVIGRMLTDTSFFDNDRRANVTYTYKVVAVDKSRNRSEASETVSTVCENTRELVAHYGFDGDLADASANRLECVATEGISFTEAFVKEGTQSLFLNGSNYVQLPVCVGSLPEITISLWALITNSSSTWTRLFDFGNGTDKYMFLTPNNGSEMRLVLKNGGEEEILSAPKATSGWHHYVVTLGNNSVSIFVDGTRVAQTSDIELRLSDLNTVANYIGCSQFASDPLLKGYIDDLRIYNFEVTANEAAQLYRGEDLTNIEQLPVTNITESVYYNLSGLRIERPSHGLYLNAGRKILIK